ncbi:acetyl-CoA acetyltransferase [Novosphingobium endophyticum]|uniref:Acetyl-CoA acetyltransferase n=1 Tax=Novosphingobium endophyticum TaxID=1955250 RepID=A0A916X6V8_9SPHN|nr:acetyl-CoA acetyltransferase [Novosphingobium endophyticum]GGC12190.1 acetyl-CoA acetyltransferase [Novosphingobium endophyticum]
MSEASIVGWGHSPFGRLDDPDTEALIARVAGAAVEDAGVPTQDVDAVFVGQFNAGFSRQNFPGSLVANAVPELHGKPAVRVENACASGAAAIYAARDFIAAGRGRIALVVGVEKMTGVTTAAAAENLLGASYRREEGEIEAGFAGVFGQIASAYFQRFGDQSDALATIAAKNHRNGLDNPFAHMRRDLGYEFCRTPSEKNPFVAAPLKRTDCSPLSDGAAAVVLADADTARTLRRAIRFRAAVQVNDYLPLSRRDPTWFEAGAQAWVRALDAAGVSIDDLSLVETHDCFTIAELIEYEVMGLAQRGKGAQAALEGWIQADGKLPVNRSGGLKSKGHPVGATGVSMHIMAAMQLVGEAGDMQLPNADFAGVYNMGGTAVANYVSILERMQR